MNRYSFRPLVIAALLCSVLGMAALAALALPQGTAYADPDTNKATVEQLRTDVALDGDNEAFDTIVADDFVGHLPQIAGDWAELSKAGLNDLITQTTRAIMDLEIESDLLLAEGDLVAQRATMRGVFASEFFDTPPTDVELEISFNILYRFNESGQLVEMWMEGDLNYLVSEVGMTLVPEE
ncbi:MAG: ester cyclase [Chloroflexi bacterium]|nr:ester cyclase [Chloroflexota bacterium]